MPVELFEPKNQESLLEGWLIHARKEREKHQECARKFQRWHLMVSLPAVALSSIAALPVVASLGQGPVVPLELKVCATVLIILAAVFVALDKKEFGGTAEKHRAAEFNYKDVIRQIEVVFASQKFDNAEANNSIQERLRIVDAQSPVVLPCVDEKFETSYKDRVVVRDLAREK
jgi:hypothetical protein